MNEDNIVLKFKENFTTPIIGDELIFDHFIRLMSIEDMCSKWNISERSLQSLLNNGVACLIYESTIIQSAIIQQIITNKHEYGRKKNEEERY
jgi:hypothetical protein